MGTYVFTLTGTVVDYPTRWSSRNLNVIVKDPCLTAILSAGTLTNMQTSVLVQQVDGTAQYVTKTVVATDSVSNSRSVPLTCGTYLYGISSVVSTATTALSLSELTINSATGLIKAWTSRNAVIGTHTVTVAVSLVSYSSVP